ncbi:DUF3606 domain-containing protein [Roseomonas harenae]|uniref:DUF3606 domain-containing protein n=1 Tax=Muricoccus harenae TaxID=2692566 RepID=UPI00133182BC|nr:DUF3606 domain-containing protein [Roseomonas harenae]
MLELKKQPEKPVRERIDITDDYDIREWAKRLGVTELDVAIAVRHAGPRVADVAMALGLPRP